MRPLIPVETDSSIARDPVSNAILTTDKCKLERYKKQLAAAQRKDDQINILNEKLNQLEDLIQKLMDNKRDN